MAPTLQRNLPISFVLEDGNGGVTEMALPIRPEDLTRTEPARLTAVQTLDGAWLDSFGRGLTKIQINGHTGWGSAGRPDGVQQFVQLRDEFINRWHRLREDSIQGGRDPDDVRLLFADALNGGYVAVVAPEAMTLKRSKSSPLLMYYNLPMTVLDDQASIRRGNDENSFDASNRTPGLLSPAGFASFDDGMATMRSISNSLNSTIKTIGDFGQSVKSVTDAALLPILTVTRNITGLALQVNGVVDAATGVALGVAGQAAKAGEALWGAVVAVESIPLNVQVKAMQIKAAFTNAFCLLTNAARGNAGVADYTGFYGASNCSSTAGGRPISPLRSVNGFESFNQATPQAFLFNQPAIDALRQLRVSDAVNLPTTETLQQYANAITSGVTFNG